MVRPFVIGSDAQLVLVVAYAVLHPGVVFR
jgi:hypothetical protein